MKTVGHATSVAELLDVVTSGDDHPLACWYRGASDASYQLLPSAFRDGRSRDQESSLLHYFRAAAMSRSAELPAADAHAPWLSLAQHWGLPTRLLDWSTSLLVATFFAVELQTGERRDAAVWALNAFNMNEHFGNDRLQYAIDSHTAAKYVEPAFYFQHEEPGGYLGVLALEHDRRIHAQQGTFTIHSCRDCLEQSAGSERWLRKVVIPAGAVDRIRRELRVLGVSRSSLFPDLAALAAQIKADDLGIM